MPNPACRAVCALTLHVHVPVPRRRWHIPGGIGAAANTANTRVLVTHLDGSQSVECIEDDLGLDVGDHAAVIRQLKKQGLWDVQSVSRAGDV